MSPAATQQGDSDSQDSFPILSFGDGVVNEGKDKRGCKAPK
jgi:hypothetical protein